MDKALTDFSKLKVRRFYQCVDEGGNVIKSGNLFDINSVGDVLEEIFGSYMCEKLPDFKCGPKQKSPDFFHGNIEVELKVFYRNPGFDIGNFYSYIHDLSTGLERKLLNTVYIILEYDMDGDYLIIKSAYIKRIWEIVSLKTKYPISCQVKYGKIHNIRPKASKFFEKSDNTCEDFIKGIIKLIEMFPYENSDAHIKSIEHQFKELSNDWRCCHVTK